MTTCDLIIEWFDDYIDGELSEAHQTTFEDHLHTCESCRVRLSDLTLMREVLQDMPLVALPDDFNESLHEKLRIAAEEIKISDKVEQNSKTKRQSHVHKLNFKKWMPYASVAAVMVIAVASSGQLNGQFFWQTPSNLTYDTAMQDAKAAESKSANQVAGVSESAPASGQSYGMNPVGAKTSVQPPGATNAKEAVNDFTSKREMIRSGDITIQVADVEAFSLDIQAMIKEVDGYIESSYTGVEPYYKGDQFVSNQQTANYTLRMPSKNFMAVFEGVKKLGQLENSQQNVIDVTNQMADLNTMIKNYNLREAQLQKLLGQASNMSDILQIDKELGEVRLQIDQLNQQLNAQKNQVSMSTLYLNVKEKPELGNQLDGVDANIWKRAVSALIGNLNNVVKWSEIVIIALVAWSPILAVVVIGYYLVVKMNMIEKWRKKK